MISKKILFIPLLALFLVSCNNTNSPTSFNSSEDISSETSSSSSEEHSSNEPSSEEPSSSEPSSEVPSSSETPSSSEPTPFTLSTPILTINEENGLASWNEVEDAEYYRYYFNDKETLTTTSTSIEVPSGSVLSVSAESSLSHIRSSDWSNPVTYYEVRQENEYINIYFHNTSINPVSILKGSTYLPATPSKQYHHFNGWFLDPYYSEPLLDDHIFNENTILYASFIEEDWRNDIVYFIKADPNISADVMSTLSSSSGWRFIPLSLDSELTKQYNKRIFSSIVSVKKAGACYIVMDGTNDDAGRTYYKNGSEDFSITATGTYKICFSVEYSWNNTNSTAIKLSSSSESIYDEKNTPLPVLNTVEQLQTPTITLDNGNELATWTISEGADYYEYVIDNGDIKTTTSNNVTLYKGSHITVRACSNEYDNLASRWATPKYQQKPSFPNSVFVYFYGSDRPSEEIAYGSVITRPNKPVKNGYEFIDWYKDISHKTVFDFDQNIYENTVIYAKFELIDEVKFELYKENKTTKYADFDVSSQYGYNEYVANYITSLDNEKVYVKSIESSKWFGPYQMGKAGEYTMYFSEEHKWDLGTANERNAYWTSSSGGDEQFTIYFSNNESWSKINYYIWGNNPETSWPGASMTFVRQNSYGQDIYKCVFDNSIYKNIIFNNGSEQTVDISLEGIASGTGFYLTNKVNGKWEVDSYVYTD